MIIPDDPTTNALGITWDTIKDTLQPIFHFHLSKKIKGIKKAGDLVGLTPDEIDEILKDIVVTRTNACDITSLHEKDLDLITRDVPLV